MGAANNFSRDELRSDTHCSNRKFTYFGAFMNLKRFERALLGLACLAAPAFLMGADGGGCGGDVTIGSECSGEQPLCAAPPEGCEYEGSGCVDGAWTCGELVCEEECTGVAPPCMAPPEGCEYQEPFCVDGQNTCGTLVCDACEGEPPLCMAPPEGCNYINSGCIDGAWTCGELVCEECTGPAPPCMAPPEGCEYQEPFCVDGQNTCGTLVCAECGDPPPCAAPPEGCDYVGFGCFNGVWTCGELVCDSFVCGDLSCTTNSQYCVQTFPGQPGSPIGYSCEATPPECVNGAACDCISMPGGSCNEAAPGQVTVTVALP
jgi:hypothetical protein